MAIKNLELILKEHPFFSGMKAGQMDQLVGCASNVRFKSGQFILREGGHANAFYLLREGKVALEIRPQGRRPIFIQTLSAGDVLGWSWLVPPFRWRFDAKTIGAARAIALDAKCLRKKCEADADLSFALLTRFSRVMVEHLQAARLQVLSANGKSTAKKRRG
jgi:CRP/FNR family transcriptional regulator, cyclic AMP receptor protein